MVDRAGRGLETCVHFTPYSPYPMSPQCLWEDSHNTASSHDPFNPEVSTETKAVQSSMVTPDILQEEITLPKGANPWIFSIDT